MLDLASGPRLSESDHKISEELAAARKRLASVAGCEPSKAKLSELAEILQSDQPNEDKLQALRSVLVTDQKVADLIFYRGHPRRSSQVRSSGSLCASHSSSHARAHVRPPLPPCFRAPESVRTSTQV